MPKAAVIASNPLPAAVLAGLLLLGGCCRGGRHYQVSSEEFLRLARLPTGSALDSRYIGATEGRAYITVWSATSSSAGGVDVYSVALDDLPPAIAQRIRVGVDPWPE